MRPVGAAVKHGGDGGGYRKKITKIVALGRPLMAGTRLPLLDEPFEGHSERRAESLGSERYWAPSVQRAEVTLNVKVGSRGRLLR